MELLCTAPLVICAKTGAPDASTPMYDSSNQTEPFRSVLLECVDRTIREELGHAPYRSFDFSQWSLSLRHISQPTVTSAAEMSRLKFA